MTVQRKQVDAYATLVMTSLCIVWGIQQVAIKSVADEISPVLQVAIRSGAAAGLICLLIILKKTPLRNFAICFVPGGAVGILFGLQFLFVKAAAWREKPSWYLLTENDNALAPSVQADFAREAGARILRIQSGHLSMISHPEAVAAFIVKAARSIH